MLVQSAGAESGDIAATFAKIAVVVPAWQPRETLIDLTRQLLEAGFGAVVVVDDGGGSECRGIFDEIGTLSRAHVLRHAVNLGKGRALKSGFNYVLDRCPGFLGVVTADADGQHAVADILRAAEAFARSPERVVLGARSFVGDVPLRSRFGNALTRQVFRFITGSLLADTQTGLRAFPSPLLPELLQLDGERYEYEMNVLAHVCRRRPPIEVPISTVYLEGNAASHFDPIRDSMRIYFVLLRFYLSSIFAAAIDFAVFTLTFWISGNILTSMIVGRTSSLVNFALNRRLVFHSGSTIKASIWRYYLLAIGLGVVSYASIRILAGAGWNILAAKIAVETLLSLVSFSIQRVFVFAPPQED